MSLKEDVAEFQAMLPSVNISASVSTKPKPQPPDTTTWWVIGALAVSCGLGLLLLRGNEVKMQPNGRKFMSKPEAVKEFKRDVLPHVPKGDGPALREAWNNYTDSLHRDGRISDRQVNDWDHPAFVKKAKG